MDGRDKEHGKHSSTQGQVYTPQLTAHRPRSCKQDGALTLVALFTSAPAATSSLTMATWPLMLALIRAVAPYCAAHRAYAREGGARGVISRGAMHARTTSNRGGGGASQPTVAGSKRRRSQLAQPAWTSVTASADHHRRNTWNARGAGEASKGHACAPLPLQPPTRCAHPAEC